MDIGIVTHGDGLLSFMRSLATHVQAGTANADVSRAVQGAGSDYLADMRARFGREGDGQWRPLARMTQEERRHLGFPPAHPILKRLGFLYGALTPGAPGNVFQVTPNGIQMGYGGEFRHPGYVDSATGHLVSGNIRLATIARRHQFGVGVPRRQILVEPKPETLQQMAMRILEGYRSLIASAIAESQSNTTSQPRAA